MSIFSSQSHEVDSTGHSRQQAAPRQAAGAAVHRSVSNDSAEALHITSDYYKLPIHLQSSIDKPCCATARTPLNHAHGPRKQHQNGPLYGYEVHATLLRAKLAAYVADIKRIILEWDDAAAVIVRAKRELDTLDVDPRKWMALSQEQREWKKEKEGWLNEVGLAETRVRKVKLEVRRKAYRGFEDDGWAGVR